jgi:hypothetical protein
MIPYPCLVMVNVISGGVFVCFIKRRCDEDCGATVLDGMLAIINMTRS